MVMGLLDVEGVSLNYSNKCKSVSYYLSYYMVISWKYVYDLYWYDIVNYGYLFSFGKKCFWNRVLYK